MTIRQPINGEYSEYGNVAVSQRVIYDFAKHRWWALPQK